MSIKLDTQISKSFIPEAQDEIRERIDQLEYATNDELILLGISILLDPDSRHRRYLTPKEEAVRLHINRELEKSI